MHEGLWLGNSKRLELQPLAHQVLPGDVTLLSFLPRQQVLGQGPRLASSHLISRLLGGQSAPATLGGEPQDHTQVSRSLEGHRIRGSC